MKIYDCFMYMNEDVVLDLRLNYLNEYVDFFVIVESNFYHSGKKKKLNFDLNKFSKFKKKIIYLVLDHDAPDIDLVNKFDNEIIQHEKNILNGMKRDFFQRNYISHGITKCHDEDIILISDIDEIPKMENFDKSILKNKIVFFKQKMFYYKFNLLSESINWYGTRACKKKFLKNPQWLRNLKSKYYPFWRLDVFFSKNKIRNATFIDDGGWHFSYLNSPNLIKKKLENYAHYLEYSLSGLDLKKINERIENKVSIYDLNADMRQSKFNSGQKLRKEKITLLPKYLVENQSKYREWLELN